MTSDDEICRFLKAAVKDEIKAVSEYRELAEKAVHGFPTLGMRQYPLVAMRLREIAEDEERHSKILAEQKEELCPGDDPDPEVAKAAEAFDGKGSKVLITLWEDDSLTVCKGDDKKDEGDCYSMDPSPANRDLFYVAEAHYSGMGFKIRTLAE